MCIFTELDEFNEFSNKLKKRETSIVFMTLLWIPDDVYSGL